MLEADPDIEVGSCLHCGTETQTIRGFVYRDADAMTVRELPDWPWAESHKFGVPMKRGEALASPDLAAHFQVADFVVQEDTRIRAYLTGDD